MPSMFAKSAASLVIGATLFAAAAPAEARDRYYRDRHRDNGGGAIIAGIAGLAIGAAIASSDRGRYDRGYYYDRPQRGYYQRPYRGYYDRGYRGYRERCYTRRVYDPYIGRRVRVRYCD